MKRARIFEVLWYSVNIALIFAALFLLYSIGWEYSTRKYLRGFSDAIIPASATPLNKAQTILDWMAHGPERAPGPGMISDRDPSDTLNYRSLLRVCGTATNAFVNVANASGLPARRLLLLDSQKQAKHVVAEVFDGSRWVIVDPSFRVIPRGADGQPLTREELQNPAVFQLAIAKIPGLQPHLQLSVYVPPSTESCSVRWIGCGRYLSPSFQLGKTRYIRRCSWSVNHSLRSFWRALVLSRFSWRAFCFARSARSIWAYTLPRFASDSSGRFAPSFTNPPDVRNLRSYRN